MIPGLFNIRMSVFLYLSYIRYIFIWQQTLLFYNIYCIYQIPLFIDKDKITDFMEFRVNFNNIVLIPKIIKIYQFKNN